MNAFDDLLTWVSERETGSLGSLRTACDWTSRFVAKPGLEILDDLLALGHVDVRDARWTVVPTVLSRLANGGGNSLMIGSRPRWVVDAVDDMDVSASQGLRALADHVYENLKVPQAGPSTWYVAVGPEAPLATLRELGIQVFDDVAGAQLRKSVERGPERQFREVRPGELVGRLDPAALATGHADWSPAPSDGSTGFYRYLRNNQRVHAERTTEGWFEIDYRWAVWLAQPAGTHEAWYVPAEGCVYLDGVVRPPLEIERALVLRTGRLATPRRAVTSSGRQALQFVYPNVTSQIASEVANLLGRDLEFR